VRQSSAIFDAREARKKHEITLVNEKIKGDNGTTAGTNGSSGSLSSRKATRGVSSKAADPKKPARRQENFLGRSLDWAQRGGETCIGRVTANTSSGPRGS